MLRYGVPNPVSTVPESRIFATAYIVAGISTVPPGIVPARRYVVAAALNTTLACVLTAAFLNVGCRAGSELPLTVIGFDPCPLEGHDGIAAPVARVPPAGMRVSARNFHRSAVVRSGSGGIVPAGLDSVPPPRRIIASAMRCLLTGSGTSRAAACERQRGWRGS